MQSVHQVAVPYMVQPAGAWDIPGVKKPSNRNILASASKTCIQQKLSGESQVMVGRESAAALVLSCAVQRC